MLFPSYVPRYDEYQYIWVNTVSHYFSHITVTTIKSVSPAALASLNFLEDVKGDHLTSNFMELNFNNELNILMSYTNFR